MFRVSPSLPQDMFSPLHCIIKPNSPALNTTNGQQMTSPRSSVFLPALFLHSAIPQPKNTVQIILLSLSPTSHLYWPFWMPLQCVPLAPSISLSSPLPSQAVFGHLLLAKQSNSLTAQNNLARSAAHLCQRLPEFHTQKDGNNLCQSPQTFFIKK